MPYTVDYPALLSALDPLLAKHLPDASYTWLTDIRTQHHAGTALDKFALHFAWVVRKGPKGHSDCLAGLTTLHAAWHPTTLTTHSLMRFYLLCSLADTLSNDTFHGTIDALFKTADMAESQALYQSLWAFPDAPRWVERAREGLRSNMQTSFEAVALDNDYPRHYFSEDAWNHMVLKALFVNSPLYRIHGIDTRHNAMLAEQLLNYARERRAASRTISPELWRAVGPFHGAMAEPQLNICLDSDDVCERDAARLALQSWQGNPDNTMPDPGQPEQYTSWDAIGLAAVDSP